MKSNQTYSISVGFWNKDFWHYSQGLASWEREIVHAMCNGRNPPEAQGTRAEKLLTIFACESMETDI